MTQVSRFSTAENLLKVNDAISQIEDAIAEAQLAVQAGVPGAENVLATGQATLKQLQQYKNTYFPTGVATA